MRLRTILLILSLLAFVSATAGGYFYYSSLRENAFKQAEVQASIHTEELRKVISLILADHMRAAKALAAIPELAEALLTPDQNTLADAIPIKG